MKEFLEIRPKVAEYMNENKPVVVLESTVWIHGLPADHSIETLSECLEAIESKGALGAVALIKKGRIIIGASVEEVRDSMESGTCGKINIRDIPLTIQRKIDGATTVSSTIFCAHLAGLPVCATGGIGGVHRMANTTYDISADLHAIAGYPVLLVSSGTKSILDVGATLEMLETLGVPVLCYKTDSFPCFYSRFSEFMAPARIESAEEASEIFCIHKRTGMKQGILVANPIPESSSLSFEKLEKITEKALMEAYKKGIRGKGVTPFLLKKLHEDSHGETVTANIALLKDNAGLAGEIAVRLWECLGG